MMINIPGTSQCTSTTDGIFSMAYGLMVHGLYKPTYNCRTHLQYPLVLTNILLLNMAIEIVSFTIKMVDLSMVSWIHGGMLTYKTG